MEETTKNTDFIARVDLIALGEAQMYCDRKSL